MITVSEWTGEEALLLRSVKRESVRDFARRLGISPRTVSFWQSNPVGVCRPATQQLLDTALARCSGEEKEAFRVRLAALRGISAASADAPRPGPCSVVSHKFLPVYIGESARRLYEAGSPYPHGPGGLDRRVIGGEHHTAHASSVHIYACGVAVVHLEEICRVATLTELALWRYRSYPKDRQWAGQLLQELLQDKPDTCGSVPTEPEYVLSAYEVREHSWDAQGLDTALQLLSTPSVLVDRQDPLHVSALGSGVEDAKFADGWSHPEAVLFGGAASRGVAGWSGVAYHPRRDERALTMGEIIALELDAQALWALSSHILHMVEMYQDPVMPEAYGWRYLRGAHSRLTAARPTETAQHRVMREAILATSELPDRLRAAQDALRDSGL
ncbi:transcriptional regulator [Streptomyces spiroverticillatus]|uniref:Transcriptional regulator n=1 Tax=Streptomyces finlayi TaxID=67296 RepID=A0A918X775_9ACTN|nr:XRE family transcriptional regulator [Streptomyces finlayi]GHA46068.1 transcriptional regulator [Streptomyces spiroverticillatus]GHD16099.1 transcriptional regulator [Streptomyces finlayi]